MGFTRRLITLSGKNREHGEEVHLQGAALRVDPGAGAPEVYVAFNDPTYDRTLVRPGEVLRSHFDRLWVFHDSLDAGSGPLELVAMDSCDDIEAGGKGVVLIGPDGKLLSVIAPGSQIDTITDRDLGILLAGSLPYYKSSSDTFDVARAPNRFGEVHGKSAAATTVILASQVGLKLRLLRYRIAVSADASLAAAGALSVQIGDWDGTDFGNNVLHEHRWYLPAAAVSNAIGALDTGWTDLGPLGRYCGNLLTNGNSIALKIGTALATGEVSAWVQAIDALS